jgi:peptidoglycan/LPS O-acetylase OafA/YrhL
VFTHTWSLGVHEQFYLIYPIILWLCLRNNPSRKPLDLAIIAGFALPLFLFISRMITGHFLDLSPGKINGFIAIGTCLWPSC